jgi:hypothetical protein
MSQRATEEIYFVVIGVSSGGFHFQTLDGFFIYLFKFIVLMEP